MSFKYFPLTYEQVNKRKIVWDGLAEGQPFGRAALRFVGTLPDFEEVSKDIIPADEIPLIGPVGKYPEWDSDIRNQVRAMQVAACSSYTDDSYPAIYTTRSVFGQTQAIAEAFGCRLVPQESEQGLYFPIPWIKSALDIDRLKVIPIEKCMYGRSIEFVKYAREVTDGQLSIRNPVITGPIDTANYVLGSMRLMEWIYEEPKALHKLLDIITDVIIYTIKGLQKAADGQLCSETCGCLSKGFGLCSEVRHLISLDSYNEFEAPYLRRIGKECGLYAVHSCGTWERTLPSVLQDGNIMLVNFQCREMDLSEVFRLTGGKLSLSVARSINLGEKYIWPDWTSFFRYIMTALTEPVPMEIIICDNNMLEAINSYLLVKKELKGGVSGMFK